MPLAICKHAKMPATQTRVFAAPINQRKDAEGMKVFHSDHGVSEATLVWALAQINPEGFFLRTLTLPPSHAPLANGLYGPASGDAPVADTDVHFAKRSEDRPASRMIALPKRETRLLTIIGMVKDGETTIFTAYGGPAAEREPGDATLTTEEDKERAAAFWAVHALAAL